MSFQSFPGLSKILAGVDIPVDVSVLVDLLDHLDQVDPDFAKDFLRKVEFVQVVGQLWPS